MTDLLQDGILRPYVASPGEPAGSYDELRAGLADDSRLLAIIVARIGDTLLATPALRALKHAVPRGMLEVLAHPQRMQVLENLPFIDRLGPVTKARAAFKGRLARKDFYAAVVYGRDRGLVDYASRIAQHVVCFASPELQTARRDAVRVPPSMVSMHAAADRLLLAQALGARTDDLRLAYRPRDSERSAALEWIRAEFGNRPQLLLGLQIESFPTKAHRDWPVESFEALLEKAIAAWPHCRAVVLGEKSAARRAAQMLRRFSPRVRAAAGTMSIRETAALISHLDLYVGVDTGPTHLAGALGVPMVCLYHPAYPGRNLVPLDHPRCIAIEHPLTGKTSRTDASMGDIAVDTVFDAVRRVLPAGAPS